VFAADPSEDPSHLISKMKVNITRPCGVLTYAATYVLDQTRQERAKKVGNIHSRLFGLFLWKTEEDIRSRGGLSLQN
jgi:hypothetical protein